MSRKIILTLATALAAATLVVGTADAKKPNNGPNNGPHWKHHHHHIHFTPAPRPLCAAR